MSNNNLAITGYEQRILQNMPKSEADKLTDKKLMQRTVNELLSTEIEHKLSDGKIINAPISTILVAKKIDYDLRHPEKADLMMYAKLLGETTDKVEITKTTADELFGDIVNKENE